MVYVEDVRRGSYGALLRNHHTFDQKEDPYTHVHVAVEVLRGWKNWKWRVKAWLIRRPSSVVKSIRQFGVLWGRDHADGDRDQVVDEVVVECSHWVDLVAAGRFEGEMERLEG